MAGRILWAWFFTIPASALIATAIWFVLRAFAA
jgi:phosphate/sulfate permease